jgi:hypothetical protein
MFDQRLNPGVHRIRHPQELQRVAGRRRVEDDQIEMPLAVDDQIDDAIEQGDFQQTGRGRRHVDLLVRLLQHVRAEHPPDVALHVGDVARRLSFRIDLERRQVRVQLPFGGTDLALEDVRGRMRRIGGHQQHAAAGAAGGERERRRAGGLPHPALAAEEDDLTVEQRGQQHGRLPIGECSMPMRRCQS